MKQTIRFNTFETNSSSTHAYTLVDNIQKTIQDIKNNFYEPEFTMESVNGECVIKSDVFDFDYDISKEIIENEIMYIAYMTPETKLFAILQALQNILSKQLIRWNEKTNIRQINENSEDIDKFLNNTPIVRALQRVWFKNTKTTLYFDMKDYEWQDYEHEQIEIETLKESKLNNHILEMGTSFDDYDNYNNTEELVEEFERILFDDEVAIFVNCRSY